LGSTHNTCIQEYINTAHCGQTHEGWVSEPYLVMTTQAM
jgi:hypothetical protein